MSFIIKDGTGKGYLAKVGSNNRLATDSITETIQEKAITEGDGYNVATSRITLTTTNESALFYIENLEDQDLILTSVFLNTVNGAGTLTGGQPVLKIYRNPSSGTIISNAKPILTESNSNFGSNKSLDARLYEGVEGDNLTGQDAIIDVPLPSRAAVTFIEFQTRVILPKGSMYGISYQPEAGSTSVDVITGLTLIKLPATFA